MLLGGFTTNCIWCVILNIRNRTGHQYFSKQLRANASRTEEKMSIDVPGQETVEEMRRAHPGNHVPLLANWFFSALAGVTWYLQFFFYSMGESQMGAYGFSSWTMHMASIIIFSTLWGIFFKEWTGSSPRTKRLLGAGLVLLIFSTIIVGYGNFLGAVKSH